MTTRDITEGRGTRSIAFDVGVVSDSAPLWQNTDMAYDVAIGGMPFVYAISDKDPYIRQTAPFRKEQFDNGTEPGEQSLTGWWLRSQSSFHSGTGINFYDTTSGEETLYRFDDSRGVDVWTKGQVTLLSNSTQAHHTTTPVPTTGKSQGRPPQMMRTIRWDTTDGVLLHDGYDVDKIDSNGVETHFIDYISGADDKVYAVCDDGTTAYWVTNDTGPSGKCEVNKKLLTGNGSTAATVMFTITGLTVTTAAMEYVKDRIVMCVNDRVYEFPSNATTSPTAIYTHGDDDVVFTSIAESGAAIYIAGFSGIQSFIMKFTLNTNGTMPTLTTGITAAEMPAGEIIYRIYQYLGYMLIGTSKGMRVANINDQDGSISYGPLVFESTQPVYDFAARDRFVWCAASVGGNPGLVRVDLGNEISPLRFAYANDLYYGQATQYHTTCVAFLGATNRLAYATAAGSQFAVTNKARTGNVATLTAAGHGLVANDIIYVFGVDAALDGGPFTVTSATTNTFDYTTATSGTIASTPVTNAFAGKAGFSYLQHATDKIPSGYLQTGFIRYNTLEPKNFKRIIGRGDFTYGSLGVQTVDANNNVYDVVTYSSSIPSVEVNTPTPSTPQEYLGYKFIFSRDATTPSQGPVFKGYQAKSTIASPRQRIIRFPVYCFDVETDKYNVMIGYEGRALERIASLEAIEADGDIVVWQDLTTNETRQCTIEQIQFTRMTPPDRGFTGYGGILTITIRTV